MSNSTSFALLEDKKCRMCGLAKTSNINIFNDRILQNKISTVYPIVLHPEDPLPKNICRKCVSSVSSTYNDIQRVIKLQDKWIKNVRLNEPNHCFLQVLKVLEDATEAIKNLMNATFCTMVPDETINRLITKALGEGTISKDSTEAERSFTIPLTIEDALITKIKEEPLNGEEDKGNKALSKMILNKKTLPNMCRYCSVQFESLAKLALHQNKHLRLQIPKIFQTKYLSKKSRRGRLIAVNDRQSIRCLNCWRIFNDNKCILEHWSNAECDFYCQICGKEFEHSPKSLREHVLVAHGINYTSLKTQRQRLMKKAKNTCKQKKRNEMLSNKKSPKEKKDNHKLSLLEVSQTKSSLENSKTTAVATTYNPKKLVTCRICSRAFQNFKACNSHMRAHKPPYAYGDTAPLPDVDADAYMELERKELKKKPPSQEMPEAITSVASCTPSDLEPIPALSSPSSALPNTKNISKEHDLNASQSSECSTTRHENPQTSIKNPTTTAPRGIRMKFVTRRNDLNGSGLGIKVKSLTDLQGEKKPHAISNHLPIVNEVQNILPSTRPAMSIGTSSICQNIKSEPIDETRLKF